MKTKLTLLLLCFCSSVFSEEYQLIKEETNPYLEKKTTLKRYSDHFILKNKVLLKKSQYREDEETIITEAIFEIVNENGDWLMLLNTLLNDPNDSNYQSKERGNMTQYILYIIDKKKLEFVGYSGSYNVSKRYFDTKSLTGTFESLGRLILLEE